MKKFIVWIAAFAGASYEVEAETKEEAIEKAYNECSLSDCRASDWDYETAPDVEEIIEE